MHRHIALQKIIDLGSFSKAAEALGYTQSSISQMISSLEDELSIKLLYRSRVGVKLTLEGADLYPFIQRSILQYQAMQQKVNEIKGLETGVIRVGTISSITCHWMPQLIKEFQALYPNVQFILHQGDYSSIQEWIKAGAVDFGFITPPAVTGLQTITIKEGSMLAVLPSNHKLASQSTVNLHEIVNEPFILLEEGHFSEPMEAFHVCNLEPNIKFRMHDDYAIMTMVEAGLGISVLAELVLRRTNYNIVSLPVDPPVIRTLAIGYKDKNSLPIASKYFIEYLLSNIEKLP
ncbi:HTH-type transcriptional regulator GltC [Sporomusa silvacetica DSM 10669]|uniref:HTH-type transcriptional regulator GltC n=1 Tax=Sporomusa silvacetica DSM 10669 TaxID=1123289 RepID=A0ABZ3INU9_9FIRM|nr:LysR family transcriptional regulator [Sporomusa silvacetica]OZC14053.1 HTH-type transcriptional regulator GltC [Sporomusa silvacetica DSM 10669]